MGCDDCWICRSSYPDSITINNLTGYGGYGGYGDCCANLLGTFATSEWGEGYNTGGVFHQSFGTTRPNLVGIPTKSKCLAFWFGSCDGNPLNYTEWKVYMWAGFEFWSINSILPGNSVIATDVASTRIDVLIDTLFSSLVPDSQLVTRREHYRVDLPKPCPESGVFALTPIGTPEVAWSAGNVPVCWRSTDFLHSVTIEITAP